VTLRISNRQARWLWLDSQWLSTPPTGQLNLLQIIKDLGFVQLDTIRNVTRAHHHILWSRNQHYREPMLNKLLAKERTVFEHFTHDASVIPMEFYPMWARQFRRMKAKISKSDFYKSPLNADDFAQIKSRIATEGPLSTHAFDTKIEGKKEMWARPPHKKALDHMWYCGELATSHRDGFIKYYDLAERVIPAEFRDVEHSDEAQMDWLCREALHRLGFGAPGDIQRLWAAMDAGEVRNWITANERNLVPAEIECKDRTWTNVWAPEDIEERLGALKPPTSRLRILSPFDPVIRDRNRLSRLFGFDYRIEIFVPAAKRKWGYYVYPMLEGDRMVGRVELKADRKAGELYVEQIWPEPKVKWTSQRQRKLEAELDRLQRFIGASQTIWRCQSLINAAS